LDGCSVDRVDLIWGWSFADSCYMDLSGLIRDGVDRERMLDMDRRLAPVRRRAFAVLAVALLASGPWIGWWTLIPLFCAVVLFGLADRLTATMTRPEYALFGAWAGSEALIAASVALTGGPTVAMTCWLAIPLVTLVARFSDRGIAVGVGLAIALLLAVTVGVDAGAVLADPTLVIAPLALIVVVTMFAVALMRSDVEQRGRALIDPLTAMLNRAALEGRVEELTQQSAVTGEAVAMILVDIDRFKVVNDTRGHGIGDAVLRHVAYVIRTQLRAFDLAYRIGGEEFLILLPGADGRRSAGVAEQIREAVEAESIEGVTVTISCGLGGSYRGRPFDYEAAFAECDRALYEAKGAGRNRVRGSVGTAVLTPASGDLSPPPARRASAWS
jgi:diguanylate cyclase (GGDEF)-like protein